VPNVEFAAAVEKLLKQADRNAGGRGKITAVFSNKGGVGTTSVSANLAVALARVTGKEVALADLDLQAGGHLAFGDDVERLIAARKPGLAFTLGAMGSRQHNFYNDAFKRAGYTDAALEVQRLWLDGKREAAAARVPDDLALKVNLLGTSAMVRERLETYRRAGITTLRVDPAGSTLTERLDTLARVMDLLRAM
jgi:hypothetical protein